MTALLKKQHTGVFVSAIKNLFFSFCKEVQLYTQFDRKKKMLSVCYGSNYVFHHTNPE